MISPEVMQIIQDVSQQSQQMREQQQLLDAKQGFAESIKKQIGSMIKPIVNRRRTLEDRWIALRDAYAARHRSQGFKSDTFNHFIPAARRSNERYITRAKQMLFPSPNWFEVYPLVDNDAQSAEIASAWQTYMTWRLSEVKMRQIAEQILRCRNIYQRGIVKTTLELDEDGLAWPGVRVVDPFDFYIFPETCTDVRRATLLIENVMMPLDEYNAWVELGALDFPVDPSELTKPEWPWHYMQRLSQQGLSLPTDTPSGDVNGELTEPVTFLSISEVWWKQKGRWVQAWLLWNVKNAPHVLRVSLNAPIMPYDATFVRLLPGEQYTSCMMDDLTPLNSVLNDQVNMTLEGQSVANFPPTVVNPDLIARQDSLTFGPRRKWLGDPSGFKVLETGANPGAGFQGMQMVFGLVDSFSNSNPLSEGQPTRGMPRAGFAVSSLINLSMADIRDGAEAVEDDILTPVLKKMAHLTISSVPPEQLVMVPKTQALANPTFRVALLRQGKYAFRWVGSLQSQDSQQRAQRIMAMLKVFGSMFQQLNMAGYTLDFVTIANILWREGIGERGAAEVIVPMNPEMKMRMAMQAMGPPPGPGGGEGAPGRPASPTSSPKADQIQESRSMAQDPVNSGMKAE